MQQEVILSHRYLQNFPRRRFAGFAPDVASRVHDKVTGGRVMKKLTALCAAVLALSCLTKTAEATASAGAAGFEANCAECHPGGENSVNPAKNLRVMTLRANGIVSAQDIIAKMRNPGPGMARFDPKDLPDKEAREIARYILATFR
jgi:cytochrome c6